MHLRSCWYGSLYKWVFLDKLHGIFLITDMNWWALCQLLPILMASDSEAETSASINSRRWPNSLANNVSNYMDMKALGSLLYYITLTKLLKQRNGERESM